MAEMKPDDLAYHLLTDGFYSRPQIFKAGCYICEDIEYALMGLPLCKPCPICGGHVAADSIVCNDCGNNIQDYYIQRKA